ncbi:unnamed protein product [Cylindrotheca closterium]|uniref:Bifunctional lysine-specific demethylase and histidyl-hydroxylase n=1 Tax=Cylindrotheca closterium TaxID=2856 RepID=A0AAD2CMS1_9STRA|nr:unnamed protein product [Cylindrotheca closterium]
MYYLFLLSWNLMLAIHCAHASLIMQNKLRVERSYVPEGIARGVFEAMRDDMIPHPQDAISKKLLTINGDAGKSIDFSNNWDKIQAFRDITNEEPEAAGKVSGILRIQEMKQSVYEYAKWKVNEAVENRVMEDGGTVHLYLSRPESSALANHTDTTDIFVLQLSGAKEWILCDNEASRLLDKNLRGKLDKCTTYTPAEMDRLYCERTTLYPGDALYLPKQVVHSARATSDGLSAHLTFGFADNTCSLSDMDTCLSPRLIDHNNERRRLTCNYEEGGSSCNTSCDEACNSDCNSNFGTSSCDGSCNMGCDGDCNICVPQICNSFQGGRECFGSCDANCNADCNESCNSSCDGAFNSKCNSGCDSSCDESCDSDCNSNCRICPTPPPTPPPTAPPSAEPSTNPSQIPSSQPSTLPSAEPSASPSQTPTSQPTPKPSLGPTTPPTPPPTPGPTNLPTPGPTASPSSEPTPGPSLSPTRSDSSTPTASPTPKPSPGPTTPPTQTPSPLPSSSPTETPSAMPTFKPSQSPSSSPTVNQTQAPSQTPSILPTAIEIIVAPEAASMGNSMIYGIAGGAAALLLLLTCLYGRKRKRDIEKTSVEVKERGDGSIKVKKTTKFKGSPREQIEIIDFPNEPTANANGYFLTAAEKPVNRFNSAPMISPNDSPTQSVSSDNVPMASAVVPDDLETPLAAPASGGTEESLKAKEAARRDKVGSAARQNAAGGSRRSGDKKSRSRNKDSRPGAFSSDNGNRDADGGYNDSKAARKSGKESSKRSNGGSGSSASRSKSRHSSDEKLEARRHRSSGPNTPGAHHGDSKSPRSHRKKGSSSRGSRSGGRSRKVVASGEVKEIPPPDISESNA